MRSPAPVSDAAPPRLSSPGFGAEEVGLRTRAVRRRREGAAASVEPAGTGGGGSLPHALPSMSSPSSARSWLGLGLRLGLGFGVSLTLALTLTLTPGEQALLYFHLDAGLGGMWRLDPPARRGQTQQVEIRRRYREIRGDIGEM